jgi:hypothetical protein
MVKCAFLKNYLVDAPNLVFVRCIAPERWVPLFKNFGALVTGSVMLDDSLLSYGYGYRVDDDESAQTSDDDESVQTSDDDDDNNSAYAQSIGKPRDSDDSDFSDDFCDEYSDDVQDNHDCGSDINSDSDTYEYSEIANGHEDKQFENLNDGHNCNEGSNYLGCNAMYLTSDYKSLGGHNILHSLSNAQNLELLGHLGEVHTSLLDLLLDSIFSQFLAPMHILPIVFWSIEYIKYLKLLHINHPKFLYKSLVTLGARPALYTLTINNSQF